MYMHPHKSGVIYEYTFTPVNHSVQQSTSKMSLCRDMCESILVTPDLCERIQSLTIMTMPANCVHMF